MADSHALVHDVLDGSPSEHIYIGSEEGERNPVTSAQTVREKLELDNPVRRTRTQLTLYAEGFLKVAEYRSGKRESYRLDLRYLDPVPTITRVVAARTLRVTLGVGALAAVAALLAYFGVAVTAMLATAIVAVCTALGTLWIAIYRSYERIGFCTLHGRADVLALRANLGAIRRARALVPALSRAIEESAESIGDDTSTFLRGEMREHYRLRGDGVLSSDSCAHSTSRILAQFDVQL